MFPSRYDVNYYCLSALGVGGSFCKYYWHHLHTFNLLILPFLISYFVVFDIVCSKVDVFNHFLLNKSRSKQILDFLRPRGISGT